MEFSKKFAWPGCVFLLICFPKHPILLEFLSHGTSKGLKSWCPKCNLIEDCSSERSDERAAHKIGDRAGMKNPFFEAMGFGLLACLILPKKKQKHPFVVGIRCGNKFHEQMEFRTVQEPR